MTIFLLLALALFTYKRLLTYLHIYQQEEYQPLRFLRWLVASASFDRRLTALVLVVGLLEFSIRLSEIWGTAAIAVGSLLVAIFEKDPRQASKKKLVLTARARRIFYLALVLSLLLAAAFAFAKLPLLVFALYIQLVPCFLPLANLLLTPYERRVQGGFWQEAHSKLLSLKPTVIGITGSYGKTSTKHLLGHILELQAPTLITPGSVNTPMGIARIVRERLAPHHRFFICEMGAYGPGSIARLCRLAPPQVGVITAIGKAHYERFKTLETVASAKFELAEAVAQAHGTCILHEQVLEFPAAKDFLRRPGAHVSIVGVNPAATLRILREEQSSDGIKADVVWDGQTYTLHAPIFGEHHVSNMAVAFATACSLGVAPQDAILALASTPQIVHRLEVKSGIANSKLIDDAYNSNPVGFASALRLLSTLQTNGGRRILVTPGMVEMGSAHDTEHQAIGHLAASHADVLLPVLPARIPTLVDAFRQGNPAGLVIPCANFTAAQNWLGANVRSNDVVLMENDLPDLYETRLRL